MRAHPSLTKLALRANVIGASSSPAGLRALASALGAADTRVRSLDLHANHIVGDQEARLHEAWNGRPVDCPAGLRI